jgi:hypothetical protein
MVKYDPEAGRRQSAPFTRPEGGPAEWAGDSQKMSSIMAVAITARACAQCAKPPRETIRITIAA